MELSDSQGITKSLWIWTYHTRTPEITRHTTGRIELFYAADEREVREIVEGRGMEIEAVEGEVFEEELKPIMYGFVAGQSYYDGKAKFNPDGTIRETPIHGIEPI